MPHPVEALAIKYRGLLYKRRPLRMNSFQYQHNTIFDPGPRPGSQEKKRSICHLRRLMYSGARAFRSLLGQRRRVRGEMNREEPGAEGRCAGLEIEILFAHLNPNGKKQGATEQIAPLCFIILRESSCLLTGLLPSGARTRRLQSRIGSHQTAQCTLQPSGSH